MPHQFYDHSHLSIEQKIELIRDAKSKCYQWWVDILDCKVSFHRQCIKMEFDEIMAKFNKKCHFVVIHRQVFGGDEDYLEVGFCTFTQPEYFLWIFVELGKLPYFIEKYQLTKKL